MYMYIVFNYRKCYFCDLEQCPYLETFIILCPYRRFHCNYIVYNTQLALLAHMQCTTYIPITLIRLMYMYVCDMTLVRIVYAMQVVFLTRDLNTRHYVWITL